MLPLKLLEGVESGVLARAVGLLATEKVAYVRAGEHGITAIVNGHIVSISWDGSWYKCTCMYFKLHRKPCKHVAAALLYLKTMLLKEKRM